MWMFACGCLHVDVCMWLFACGCLHVDVCMSTAQPLCRTECHPAIPDIGQKLPLHYACSNHCAECVSLITSTERGLTVSRYCCLLFFVVFLYFCVCSCCLLLVVVLGLPQACDARYT